MIKKQFQLPTTVLFLADYFPTVTWREAKEAYFDAVVNVLQKNGINGIECNSLCQPYLDEIIKEFTDILEKDRKKIILSRTSNVPYIWVDKE